MTMRVASCSCGQLRLTCEGEPVRISICHCLECQKRTGNPLDEKGRLVIYPGNSCEMGVGCRNHTDAVSGLRALTGGLLNLAGGKISATDRAWLESFAKRIQLTSIAVEEEGYISFWFDDDDLFAGHSIHVYGNMKEGLKDAEIAG